QRARRRIVAEQAFVVGGDAGDRERTLVGNTQRAGRGVQRVGADLVPELGLERVLLALRQVIPCDAVLAQRTAFQPCHRFAMQPVRAPVRRDERAMAPYGAELLATHAL